jgi:hypothetical protein
MRDPWSFRLFLRFFARLSTFLVRMFDFCQMYYYKYHVFQLIDVLYYIL